MIPMELHQPHEHYLNSAITVHIRGRYPYYTPYGSMAPLAINEYPS